MKCEWWDFHSVGDEDCDACATAPQVHYLGWSDDCDGLIHTQLNEALEALETKCDRCGVGLLPEPAIG